MQTFIDNLLYCGIRDRLEPEARIKLLYINSIIFFGTAILVGFGLRDLESGDGLLGGITLGVAGLLLGLYGTIWVTRSYRVGVWSIPFLMFGFFSYLTASNGVGSSVLLWILTFPVIEVFLAGSVQGAVFSSLFLATQAVLLFVPGLSPAFHVDQEFKLRLIGTFSLLFTFSIAFESLRRSAQKELAKVAAELSAAKVETDGILTNVTEGIFLIGPDLVIARNHSHSLGPLLHDRAPAGKRLPDLLRAHLPPRELEAVQEFLPMFFLPSPPWHLMDQINPLAEVTLAFGTTERRFTFAFNRVELTTGRRILGTVRDVTPAWDLGRRLQAEENRVARQMRHLFQILHVKPELLWQFLQDAESELASVTHRLQEATRETSAEVEELYHGVHAVKGNAALVGLTAFAERVHEFEEAISDLRGSDPRSDDFLGIAARLTEVQGELAEIRELLERMTEFQHGLEASTQGKDLLIMALEKAVERLSQDTGLTADLDTSGFAPRDIPGSQRKLVKDVLVQLVRNSFAHGLEPEPARQASHKAPRGQIQVATTVTNEFTLRYSDDGRGFDVQRLRAVARTLEPWAGVELADDAVVEVAFASGVSTAERIGLAAGRGIGLGLVRQRVEQAGGRLAVTSIPGKGVAFDITLPLP